MPPKNSTSLNRLKTIFYVINKKEFKTFEEAIEIYFVRLSKYMIIILN